MDLLLSVCQSDTPLPAQQYGVALKAFNSAYEQVFSFGSEFTVEAKRTISKCLVDGLRAGQWDDSTRFEALRGLKILARVRGFGLAYLHSSESLTLFASLASLPVNGVGETAALSYAAGTVSLEAVKVLMNAVIGDESAQETFLSIGGLQPIMNILQTFPAGLLFDHHQTVNMEEAVFFFCRMLVHLSALKPVAAQLWEHNAKGFHTCLELIQCCEQTPNFTTSESLQSVALETSKVLFNMLHLYLKESIPIEEVTSYYHKLIPLLVHTLTFVNDSPKILDLKLAQVNLLIEIPRGFVDQVISTYNSAEGILNQLANSLLELLLAQADKADCFITSDASRKQSTHAPGRLLTGIIMALNTLCRENEMLREFFKDQILPPAATSPSARVTSSSSIAPPVAATDPMIKRVLIRLMTSPEYELKRYVSEFLFTLCDEDADEMIRQTGFGNAVGMLVEKGIFQLQQS